MSVRIMIADDHPIVRDGVRGLLEDRLEFMIIAEVGDGSQVVPLVEQLKPDVVVLDLAMPGLGGIEIARQIGKLDLGTRVIILSRHSNENYVIAALAVGVLGYVTKQSAPNELITAINSALAGERYLCSSISSDTLRVYQKSLQNGVGRPLQMLTPRERQVLHLITEGFTNQQIAARLRISVRTVEGHRSNLMNKLRVKSTAELIHFSIEKGIHPPD